ncbi:hypothetical protein Q9L58_010908, partial [Maublancomyces gigas]
MQGIKNARLKGGLTPRKTLPQLINRNTVFEEKRKEATVSLLNIFNDEDAAEARQYINALCDELSVAEVQNLSTVELAEKISALNTKRLRLLRACAEETFLFWYGYFQNGAEALNILDSPRGATIADLVDSNARPAGQRKRNSARLLFDTENPHRLTNVLQYVLATTNGFISGIHGRYHHLARSFGGKPILHAHLHPSILSSIALWTMLMVDTGANCEVVREMPLNCLSDTNDPTHKKVLFDNKARAGGIPIIDVLPLLPQTGQRISSVEAIYRYIEMSTRMRHLAADGQGEKLFLMEYLNAVKPIEEFTARGRFIEMTGRSPELAGLEIRPSYIRPSMLLEVCMRTADGTASAQCVAQH